MGALAGQLVAARGGRALERKHPISMRITRTIRHILLLLLLLLLWNRRRNREWLLLLS